MNNEKKKKVKYLLMAQTLFKSTVKLNNTVDESDEDELVSYLVGKKLKGSTPVRVENYVEDVVPRFTAKQFQQHFRMSENVFETLLQQIGLTLKIESSGRPNMDERKQLLSVLWLLATPDSYRSIAERFDMGKSSLWESFNRVINALNNIAPQVITWPAQNEMKKISDTFKIMSRAGLPNVIGAIDGCHISIKAPQNHGEVYITRKCVHAITLQAICDCSLKFINCYAGYPGSVGDYRIFRNSDIYQQILENRVKYLPEDLYIVGDKAYPVLDWCIPPYIDRGVLTAGEKNFNMALSRVRQTIERSFALLKGRFRRLKYLDMARTDLIPKTILACCVLHNICLTDNDSLFTIECIEEGRFEVNDEINIDHGYVEDNGLQKRDILMLNIH